MADHGFGIEEDLITRGVRLNIPPFLRGKEQFDEHETSHTCGKSNGKNKKKFIFLIEYYQLYSLTDIADRRQIFIHPYVNNNVAIQLAFLYNVT